MELKRYVLMNDRKILDLRKIGLTKYITVEEMVKNYGKVKSTSDNILDLVEVGDLVETKRDGILEVIGEGLYTKIANKLYSIDIINFYKRQPNGDYKKYEVK